jgi:hypothetical protein
MVGINARALALMLMHAQGSSKPTVAAAGNVSSGIAGIASTIMGPPLCSSD